jgi:hypothetical protein
MQNLIKFVESEDGAVTVDWVVLTAAIVGLGVAVIASVSSGATDVSGSVGASLESASPPAVEFVITDLN